MLFVLCYLEDMKECTGFENTGNTGPLDFFLLSLPVIGPTI